MTVFNIFVLIAVFAVLLGCERYDNPENASFSSDTEQFHAQLYSDANQATNGMDCKTAGAISESVALIVTNQQLGGRQSGTETSGLVVEWHIGSAGMQLYQGSELEGITLTIGQEWTNSLSPKWTIL